MKRLLLFIALASVAHAAGSVQQNIQNIGGNVYAFSFNWVGDASNGTVPATVAQGSLALQGYRVISMETTPGSPAPTNAYSITLIDNAGVDIMAGAATSLSSSSPQSFAGSPTAPPLYGSFTFTVTGNAVASAKGSAVVYLAPLNQVLGLSPSAPNFPAQGANLVFASPNGSSGSPGFRAIAIPGDLGSNIIPLVNGGTGVTAGQGVGDTKVQLAGTNSGVVGATLCDDANGGATTTGCTATLPAGTQLQTLRIQPNTGNNTTLQFSNLAYVNVADFNFPSYSCNGSNICTQGGGNGMSLAIGNNTLTMNPVPQGVNGTDSGHYLYVSGGTGTAEACVITGGTGTAGLASGGTIIINCANTHSGAWTLVSATAGIQELLQNASSTGTGSAYIPPGTYAVNGRITLPANVSMIGAGPAAVNINVATSSGANTTEITTLAGGRLEGFTVTLTSAATMNCVELDSFGNGLMEKINCQGGQDGIRVNLGSGNSNFTDIQVNNQSRNGVFINADSSGEVRFTRVRVSQSSLAAGATGFLITKTGTTDLGGIYLNDSLANNMGTGLFYNSTLQSPMPLWIGNSVFDLNNVGMNLVNNSHLKINGSWINSNGVSNSLILNGVTNFIISGNKILGAGSGGIEFLGTDTNGAITGNDMSLTGTAFNFVSSPTVSGILFRGNDIGSATLTSSAALMATASAQASNLTDGPLRVQFLSQSAAIGATNFITAAPASQYRLSWYTVITQAATTSSGLNINLQWNDGTATNTNVSPTLSSNTVGAFQTGSIMITSAAAQNILYSTSYASVGATVMKYSVWFTLEQL